MPRAITFDTLSYVKKLEKAGVPVAQAEAHAEAIAELVDEELATKRDLRELEMRLKHDLTLRLGGMLVTGIVIVATLVKLL